MIMHHNLKIILRNMIESTTFRDYVHKTFKFDDVFKGLAEALSSQSATRMHLSVG